MDNELKCKDCKYHCVYICIGCGENRLVEPEEEICDNFLPKNDS